MIRHGRILGMASLLLLAPLAGCWDGSGAAADAAAGSFSDDVAMVVSSSTAGTADPAAAVWPVLQWVHTPPTPTTPGVARFDMVASGMTPGFPYNIRMLIYRYDLRGAFVSQTTQWIPIGDHPSGVATATALLNFQNVGTYYIYASLHDVSFDLYMPSIDYVLGVTPTGAGKFSLEESNPPPDPNQPM